MERTIIRNFLGYNAVMRKILIVEDDPNLSRIIRSYLEREHFDVLNAFRGDTGLEMVFSEEPDLVLLDLNLPGMDGLDVAAEIHRHKDIPIIMVTARVEEADRLLGLDSGADDYISKPFSPRELVARVKAVLHRVEKANKLPAVVRVLDLEIDIESHNVTLNEQPVELTPTEYELLLVMALNPGRVYSRLQLLEILQNGVFEGFERNIDVHIKNLRGKIEEDSKNPRYIETVFGVGYRFRHEK